MRVGQQVASGPGRGVQRGADTMKRIVVSFDTDTFDELHRRARRDGTSFAEQVRQLVEWGLEAAT